MNEKRDLANEEKTENNIKNIKKLLQSWEKFPQEKARERSNGIFEIAALDGHSPRTLEWK